MGLQPRNNALPTPNAGSAGETCLCGEWSIFLPSTLRSEKMCLPPKDASNVSLPLWGKLAQLACAYGASKLCGKTKLTSGSAKVVHAGVPNGSSIGRGYKPLGCLRASEEMREHLSNLANHLSRRTRSHRASEGVRETDCHARLAGD